MNVRIIFNDHDQVERWHGYVRAIYVGELTVRITLINNNYVSYPKCDIKSFEVK